MFFCEGIKAFSLENLMTPDAYITLAVVTLILIALVMELYAPDVIFFSGLSILLLAGVLTPAEALVGFSNPGMLTVAVLFVVAYAAQISGILEWFAEHVMGRSRGGRRSLLRMMAPVFGLSAFLNNTPIVAMFTPTMRDWALRRNVSPSKFLIPLSYASIFGGTCTLIGTSTNLVVNGMLQQSSGISLGMFELAWVGIPCAMVGMLIILFYAYRVLPDNKDLSEQFQQAGREYLVEMKVLPDSPLAGKDLEQAQLRNLHQLYLTQIIRDGTTIAPVRPQERLQSGDKLVFTGQADGIIRLQNIPGLVPCQDRHFNSAMQRNGKGRIVEAVVSRSSPMLGKTIKEGNFRARYDAAVLAVHRHGERITDSLGQLQLRAGDTLLLLVGDDFVKRWNQARDFYMISKVSDMPMFHKRKAYLSLASIGTMVLFAAFGVVPILSAAMLAATVLVCTRCITVVEARRSIELNVLVVIASALGISQALEKSGAAGFLAGNMVEMMQGFGPIGLLAAVYLSTSLMTELITNNAAAALIFPIAISSATQMGIDPIPFAVAVAIRGK
jgi:di/tricarboxylate transporter